MTAPAVWLNGRRVPADGIHVSARDRGFTLADGIFETMRVRGGVVFRLEHHLARLVRGLARLQIPVPAELRSWLSEALAEVSGEAGIRLTVTRGCGPAGLAPPPDVQPTVVVTVGPQPVVSPDVYTNGLSVMIAAGRRNVHSPTAGLKTLAFTDSVVAWLDARRAGADDALWLDTDGHCSEATASNLFAVIGGALVTPPLTCAALPGITREAVCEVAGTLGLAVSERPYGPDELRSADEAFLTSSLRGIAPLVALDGRAIGTGRPGAITRAVSDAYAALVDRECRR